jgi:hypothetical protein
VYCKEAQAEADRHAQPFISLLKVHYLGRPPIAVRGTISRELYHFSSFLPVQPVDARDAKYLLASALFGLTQ